MSKKSKKKKHKNRTKNTPINFMDSAVDKQYDMLIDEIKEMQYRMEKSDKKKKKKNKHKHDSDTFFFNNRSIKERKKIIKEMEDSNFFDRIRLTLQDIAPIVIIIAKLVAALIVAILSIDAIKKSISPNSLDKLQSIYGFSRSLSF